MADTVVGDLVARLRADTSDFVKGFKDAEGTSEEFTKRMEATGKKMESVGKKLTVGVTLPIAAMGAFSVKAAMDLEESQNKVSVVFGESAKSIQNWSKDSARALGMSQQAALEAAGTFGNLFRAMGVSTPAAAKMSKSLVQLAADLASFNNANPAEVLEALRSGLVGEAEPLRRFGVSLSAARIEAKALELGLASTKAELTAGAKAQAAYAIIMEDTALAQGDFARTSDSLANQLRIAKAELTNAAAAIGKILLPVVTSAVGVVADFAGAIQQLPTGAQTVVIALAGVAAAIGPVVLGLGTLLRNYRDIQEIAPKAGAAISGVGKAAATASVIVGLTIAALELADALDTTSDEATKVVGSLDELSNHPKRLERTFREAARALDEFGKGSKLAFGEFNKGAQKAIIDDLAKKTRNLADESSSLAREFVAMAKAAGLPTQVIEAMNREIERSERAHARAADAAAKDAAATMAVGDSAQSAEERIKSYTEYVDALTESEFDMEAAQLRVEESLKSLSEQLFTNAGDINEVRSKTLDAERAIRDWGDTVKEKALLAGASMEEASNQQRYALGLVAASLEPGSPVRIWLEDYINRLNAVPRQIVTEFAANVRNQGPMFNLDGSIDFDGDPLTPFATGGMVPGPIGAPLPALLHGGEMVLTPDQQQVMGGDTYITVYGDVTNPAEIGFEVARRRRTENFLAGR